MIGTICLVPFIMALITQLYGDVIVGAKKGFCGAAESSKTLGENAEVWTERATCSLASETLRRRGSHAHFKLSNDAGGKLLGN